MVIPSVWLPWQKRAFAVLCRSDTDRHYARSLIEHQDGARDLTRLHRPERLGDVLEPTPARDHVVEIQASLLVIVQIARHVDTEAVRAHIGALQLPFGQQFGAVNRHLLPNWNHADNRRGAAGLDRLEAHLGQLFDPDRFEGVINAVVPGRHQTAPTLNAAAAGKFVGELADRFYGIRLGRIDRVSGAEPLRERQLGFELIDRNDHAGAGDPRALDSREADAAASEHGDGRTGFDTGGVQYRAHPGRHATADEGRAVERNLRVDLDQGVFVHQHFFRVS